MPIARRQLAKTERLYASGSMVSGLFATIPGVILLHFLTDTMRIDAAAAGAVVLVPKIVGILLDPLIGAASDRLQTPFGRRAPMMLVGGVLMLASFVLLFGLAGLKPTSGAMAALAAYAVTSIAYSLFAVPYAAIPPEIDGTVETATRVIGLRMSFMFIGTLMGAALPPLLVDMFGGGATGYGRMAWMIAGLALLPLLVSCGAAARIGRGAAGPPADALGAPGILALLTHSRFLTLATGYCAAMVSSAALTASLPYLLVNRLGLPIGQVGLVMAAALVLAAATAPVWTRAARRFGFGALLRLSVIIVGLAGPMFAGAMAWPAIIWPAALWLGIGSAGVQVTAFSVLAAHIACSAPHAGAALTGTWTSLEKLGLALGPATVAFILSAGNYQAHGSMPADVLFLAIGVVPALGALLAFGLLLKMQALPKQGS
jgi:Na+/melibiose symporter-like transporter